SGHGHTLKTLQSIVSEINFNNTSELIITSSFQGTQLWRREPRLWPRIVKSKDGTVEGGSISGLNDLGALKSPVKSSPDGYVETVTCTKLRAVTVPRSRRLVVIPEAGSLAIYDRAYPDAPLALMAGVPQRWEEAHFEERNNSEFAVLVARNSNRDIFEWPF